MATAPCGLGFERPGGPLVALCGLAGGAGTSTLAIALARQAARESAAGVLLCETDSRAGGLGASLGLRSERSLGELAAAALAGGELPAAPFVRAEHGLRVIAGPPGAELGDPGELCVVLAEARAAHGLVVVDGGVLGGCGAGAALLASTHALLVMPATVAGLARAELLLASPLAPRHSALLVAVAFPGASLRMRDLRQLAERYVERLVLIPRRGATADCDGSAGGIELALAAIATALRRPA